MPDMTPIPPRRLLIDSGPDRENAARALADGAVLATAFGNFYAIVTRPAESTVRRVNVAKGRPPTQVGSVTTARDRIPAMFDWAALPAGLSEDRMRGLLDALHAIGPFGFRGPAAAAVPDHLTLHDQGVRTTQVIAPGRGCPSNALLRRAVDLVNTGLLYITSANRSRYLTGAAEEPAHWRAAGVVDDFPHVAELVVIEHRDEAAVHPAYPAHFPGSVTLLSFHTCRVAGDGTPVLSIHRHGSLSIEDVRPVARRFGLAVALGPTAARRLTARSYQPVGVG